MTSSSSILSSGLARIRVPLGFICAAIAFPLAQPTWKTIAIGVAIALPGEALRVWAAGHLERGQGITMSGPYRLTRHPLYLGSAILGAGFIVAAWSVVVAFFVGAYVLTTIPAAIRTEEADLDVKHDGMYSAYREGRMQPAERSFSWARVGRNREYRAGIGFVVGFGLLAARLYL